MLFIKGFLPGRLTLVVVLCILASACSRTAKPPGTDVIAARIPDLFMTMGVFREITDVSIVDTHYVPGTDDWQVLGCYRYVLLDGTEGKECSDSMGLVRLESGAWLLKANFAGRYRWQVM